MNCQLASVVAVLQHAAEEARTRGWVILVCPDHSAFLSTYRASAGALLGGTYPSGHTAVLPRGGQLSVVPVSTPPFEGTYDILMVGWGDSIMTDSRQIRLWGAASRRVIR